MSVRVWRGGSGLAASVVAAYLARVFAELAAPDAVLEAFSIETLVEHLKRRLSKELEAARREYLKAREFIVEGGVAKALLRGEGNGFAARLVYANIVNRLAPRALRLKKLADLIMGLEELLGVYRDCVENPAATVRFMKRRDLYSLLADAEDVANVPDEDQRLIQLLEEIEARLNSIACHGYECVEVYGEGLQAVLAG